MGKQYCRKIYYLIIFSIVIQLLSATALFAQEQPIPANPQNIVNPVDIIDVIRSMFNKKGSLKSDTLVPNVRNTSLLPIVGYGLANGFIVGAAVGLTNLKGDKNTTQLSSALVSLSFTTKKQIIICARSNIYLPGNVWYLQGDWRLLFYAQPTYGLGINEVNQSLHFSIDGTDVNHSVLEQPMRFNYIRFYETVLREIAHHWYVGLGVNIDDHSNIQDESLKLDTPNPYITSHYFYSNKYGFDPSHYSTNGLLAQMTYDSRDNAVNAYRGIYATGSFRLNEKIFGGSQNSTMVYGEWRCFIPLSKTKPGLVLAIWNWGVYVTSGHVPYLTLPSIGWDTYGRSGRGYVQGRFRGVNMVYGETEFRMPISRNGLFGAVAFVNATTATNPNTGQTLFNALAPGYGVGLRIKMNKKDRTNICIDYGRGIDSHGLYFNIQETF
jgi:hypothetical protein